MRGLVYLVLGGAAACGSVQNSTTDAPPGDASAAKSGDVVWVRSMSAAFGQGIAEGPGGVVFTSSITAPTDFGGGVMTPLGAVDLAIGGFKADDGSYIYQARQNSAGAGSVYGFLQQTDSLGNPLVYGVSYGDVDLGTGTAKGKGGGGTGADGFIGRYGSNAPAWVNRIVGPGEDKIVCTAPAPGGEVYAGGWFEQTTVPTWGGQLTSAGGRDMIVARMNTFTSAVSMTKQYGGAGRDEISAIAGDGTNLILGGFFDDTLKFDGTPSLTATSTAAMPPVPSLDGFVAKLDPNMTAVWAMRFGGTGEERGTMVALDKHGDVYVAGQFQNQVAFGAVNLDAMGMHDIFVAKLHGDTGSVAWAVQLGTIGDDGPNRIVVDSGGHPVLIGGMNGDAFITSLDPGNGSVRWQKVIATSGTDYGWTISVGASGDLYAVVNLGGAFDFGKPLIGPAAPASVVMRIVP
jgi:hypothetical protein